MGNTAILPSSVPRTNTPYYVPLKKYNWVTDVIVSKQYIQNMAADIDGKFYAFDKRGILITNRWIHNIEVFQSNSSLFDDEYENYRYVGKAGTPVTSAWLKMDGVKRHLNKNGYMDTNQWVASEKRGYWVNSDGKLDLSRTNAEYKVAKNLVSYSRKYFCF